MFFRTTLGVTGVDVSNWENSPLEFTYDGSPRVTVNLRQATDDERPAGREPATICVATCEVEPPADIRMEFGGLQGDPIRKGLKQVGGLEKLPEEFQTFVGTTRTTLLDYAKRTTLVVRWRCGMPGPHNPFRSPVTHQWSLDGDDWWPMPTTFVGRFTTPWVSRPHGDIQEDVKDVVSGGGSEPLGHEMLREAWDTSIDSPRTSVVLAVAAAEIGTKQCIGRLAPQAKWLIDNLPSPPLGTLLRRYIPLMPAKLKLKGKFVRLPSKTIKTVERGVELRNKIIHGRTTEVASDELDELLLATRDLLYLLDGFSGYAWAIERVQPPTLDELGNEVKAITTKESEKRSQ